MPEEVQAPQIESTEMVQAEIGWKPEQNLMVLKPAMELEVAMERLRTFQKLVKKYFIKDVDFGVIPGTGGKPTLYKSGADKFCDVYGLTDTYEIISAERNWEKGLFAYEIRCLLHYRSTSVLVSSGLGACSTWEGKFRWRNATRVCPECGAEAIIKGKAEFGGGWVCFKKKDGCGAKFTANDGRVTKQEVGRIENPDIHDQINNVLKSAKKRAKVDAVLSATRSSGLFTQDLEEMPPEEQEEAYGYTLKGKLEDVLVKDEGLVIIKLENDGKHWIVIAHEEIAKTAAKVLPHGPAKDYGRDILLELDCMDAKAPTGTKYTKLVRILKKDGILWENAAYEDDMGSGVMSQCKKHGLYPGDGNCPKCEAQ